MKRDNDPSAPSKALYNWYPGHMAKALREIKEKLKMIDIVLEIRDARAPLASGNRTMAEAIGQKSRLIVLNKLNLADPEIVAKWEPWFQEQGVPYVFVNGLDKPTLKRVLTQARKIVEEKRLQTNPELDPQRDKLKLMIIGLPNTGKSTIINNLSGKSTAKVADKPGQTQIQQWIAVDKNIDLLDTPGVMPPQIDKEEFGMYLSAIHAIPDDIVGEELPATFVIKHYLKNQTKEFQERYKFETLEISVDEAFVQIAKVRGCLRQGGVPDLERVYKLVLLDFRKGELGKCSFGLPPVPKKVPSFGIPRA